MVNHSLLERKYVVLVDIKSLVGFGLGLWCLTPLSTIFQLYRGGEKFEMYCLPIQNNTSILQKYV